MGHELVTVSAWAESWARAWAAAWMETYLAICSCAAAAVGKDCPCTTTTTASRPRTVSRPSGFTYELVGLGVTAGSIFEIVVHNTTGEPIVLEVPGGTVFRPSSPDHQRMIVADDERLTVPAGQTAQVPLQATPGLRKTAAARHNARHARHRTCARRRA